MKIEAKQRLMAVKMDSKHGIGSVPFNQDVDYFGLKVMMTPETFLALAAPITPKKDYIDKLVEYIKEDKPVGPPFLFVEIPKEWASKNFKKSAKVDGHEGRHRMTAILKAEGNAPIEVHIFPRGGLRAKNITPEWKAALAAGLYAEKSSHLVKDVF